MTAERHGSRPPSRGFSLIDLMVVIAIVAVLISLLLPALKDARDAARAVVCLSNQRQIGLAMSMYANTYKDYTPRESGRSEPAGTPERLYYAAWPFAFRPYLDPRSPEVSQELDPTGGVGDLFASAAYYRDPARPADRHNIHYVNNGMAFQNPGVSNHHAKPPTPIWKYRRTDDVLYLTCFTNDEQKIHSGAWYVPGATDRWLAIVYDTHHQDSVIPNVKTGVYLQRIATNRHGRGANAGANALYLDGHGRFTRGADLLNIQTWDDRDYRPDAPPKTR